MIPAPTH